MFTGLRRTEKKPPKFFGKLRRLSETRRWFFASPPGPLSKKRGGGEAPGICGFLG